MRTLEAFLRADRNGQPLFFSFVLISAIFFFISAISAPRFLAHFPRGGADIFGDSFPVHARGEPALVEMVVYHRHAPCRACVSCPYTAQISVLSDGRLICRHLPCPSRSAPAWAYQPRDFAVDSCRNSQPSYFFTALLSFL